MSKAYDIMLALFIIGIVSTALNTIGILPSSFPAQNEVMNESTVEDITGLAQSSESNVNSLFSSIMLVKMLGFFISIFFTILTIIPFLLEWGVPMDIALMIQLPIWLLEIIFIAQFITGRSMKQME